MREDLGVLTECIIPNYVMARFMRAIHVFASPMKKDADDPETRMTRTSRVMTNYI